MTPDSWDIESRQNALALARHLLETGAVRYRPENPVRHGSGTLSPIHVEGRRLLAHPAVRDDALRWSLRMIEQEIGVGRIDAIAAGEGAGVPFATLIADRLRRPLVFVRKDPPVGSPHKDQIEGDVDPGWNVLLVEQLATDGHRKARFAEPLKRAGCSVNHVFVLFQYGIFDAIHGFLAPLGITLHALCTWWDVLDAGARDALLDDEAQREIHAFLHDPARWAVTHEAGRPRAGAGSAAA